MVATVPGRWAATLLAVVLGMSALVIVGAGHAASRPVARESAAETAGVAADCVIPVPSTGVQGQLSVEGGPLPATANALVPLNYTFTVGYRLLNITTGVNVGAGCLTVEGHATTAANGSFAFLPQTPGLNCTNTTGGEICPEYSEPYAPVNVSLADGTPPGYALLVAGWDGTIAAALVYQLQGVAIAPGGPTVTTSVGAPTAFRASALAANGDATRLAASLAWSVTGTGWTLTGPSDGASVNLTAVVGASVASLTVQATASDHGTPLPPVEASVEVVAVATEIESGETNRTTLDAGGTVAVQLTAVGAEGFTYAAAVDPGLGLPPVPAPCQAGTPEAGTVELACTANLTYPAAGTAQPTANLSNGYSADDWRFPEVVVTPPPDVEVSPAVPTGYALAPIPIALTAANGSGAMPYALACLQPEGSDPVCDSTPGPSWEFTPTFGTPGTYAASAWAIDADGTNASLAFRIDVVGPLAVGPIGSSTSVPTVGAPDVLNVTVSGGVLPIRYWWNASGGLGVLLQGELAADGGLNATAVPETAGPLVVTLTAVDRLGSVVSDEVVLSVGAPSAGRIAVVTGTPAGTVAAGTPVSLAWAAFDASGVVDGAFDAPAEVDVSAPAGSPEAWVNASGAGALVAFAPGVFGVPDSAWIDGVLSITLTVGTAATVAVGLEGSDLPGSVAPVDLSVVADRSHVRLFDPTVARGGSRSNATLWRATDPYGNPVPGASLTVQMAFGGVRYDAVVAAVPLPGGGSGVWVNYTAPTEGAGEVSVLDAAGDVVLGPIAVPSVPSGPAPYPEVDALAAAFPIGAAGVATFAVVRRRRRAHGSLSGEEELRRLAEGRAQAVELVERAGAADLAELEAGWTPPPAPAALADWVASLVADGTLRATVGEDGRPRFCLAERASEAPRVTVDPEALDRSLRRRDEELGDGAPGAGGARP